VARCDAEESIGIVIRTGLDAPKATPAAGIGRAVEMQLVEALLTSAPLVP
jgi:hypothetical protein